MGEVDIWIDNSCWVDGTRIDQWLDGEDSFNDSARKIPVYSETKMDDVDPFNSETYW